MKNELIQFFKGFFSFFVLTAVVLTISFLTFFRVGNYGFTYKIAEYSAKVTFINVIIISTLFALIDSLRRYFTVTRPIKKIQQSLDKVTKGDFNQKIPYTFGENSSNSFDKITKSLNLMISELNNVETLRTDFISNVSHELKTPLSVIQNYAILLQANNLQSQKKDEYVSKIIVQTERLTSMITNILKLNKLENQTIFAKLQNVNLSELVTQSLINFENPIEKKSIELNTDFDESIFIKTDSNLFILMLNNLISNAIKFSSVNGKINLSVKRKTIFEKTSTHIFFNKNKNSVENKNQKIVITVQDFGCGINSENLNRIFEKFYQGNKSHFEEGNGLGLSMVKKIVDILGYEIKVQSQENVGTIFNVII